MKTILCYGDSLTWGSVPGGARHKFEDRWPTVLGKELGAQNVRIIAEGLGGRHTVFDDYSAQENRNGAKILPTLLGSHQPLDCVIIMLGTNDLKPHISGSALAAALGMARLVQIVKQFSYQDGYPVPKIIAVAPPHCVETDDPDLRPMFAGAPAQSQKLADFYQRYAQEDGYEFFDAALYAQPSPIDGVHLDAQNTRAIGINIAPMVAKLMNL